LDLRGKNVVKTTHVPTKKDEKKEDRKNEKVTKRQNKSTVSSNYGQLGKSCRKNRRHIMIFFP
jgi:hypothetical protein